MNKLILVFLVVLLNAQTLFCAEIQIYKPNSSLIANHGHVEVFTITTVGELTRYYLESNNIPHIAGEHGVNSIYNTPVGLETYEIISDYHMKVYGWCFAVDGLLGSTLMSQAIFDPQKNETISWYYGYAEYFKGEWIGYCLY